MRDTATCPRGSRALIPNALGAFIARPLRLLGVAVAALGFGACAAVGELPIVYKIDIQQGNVLDERMLAQLQPGMEKNKVRFLLGTPLLADTFNENRWDYYYSYQRAGGDIVQRQVSLYFEGDQLSHMGGDIEPRIGAPPELQRREVLVEVPKIEKEEGFLQALKPGFLKEDEPIRVARADDEKPEAPTDDAAAQAEAAADAASAQAESAANVATTESSGSGAIVTPLPGATPPAPPAPKLDVQEEQALLSQVLQGFGRDDQGEQGDDRSPNAPSGATSSVSAAPDDGSSDEDRGFFSNLVDRYRTWEEENAASSGPQTLTPADQSGLNEN